MKNRNNVIRGGFWGALLFYLLTAFEFFYMAGPFAVYFYSAYAPILNFFNNRPILSWLNRFFLPHAVRQTSSALLNIHEIIGAIIAIAGFVAFVVGACQIYYHKLAKKGIVTGGIYNLIRHPQYISFMICSFGLLILWPRYITVITFVTMIFAYYGLAKIEEKECSEKFGQSYISYKDKTNMFVPFSVTLFSKWKLPKEKWEKIIIMLAIYLTSLLVGLGIAKGLEVLSINSLYSSCTDNSVNISVCQLSKEKINEIIEIVRSDERVSEMFSQYKANNLYLNYILPTEWYAAEIPMNGVELKKGHYSPKDYNKDLYKIIITQVTTQSGDSDPTLDILSDIHTREPITEIWIDLEAHQIIKILDMPNDVRYSGIPVAIY